MMEVFLVILGCLVTAFLAAVGFLIARFITSFDEFKKEIITSINSLNVNMGVVIEKTTSNTAELKEHNDRIRALEMKPI